MPNLNILVQTGLDSWLERVGQSVFGGDEMEHEEKMVKKEEEEREKILVPVRREETNHEEEILEEPAEKIWKMPRRWRVY